MKTLIIAAAALSFAACSSTTEKTVDQGVNAAHDGAHDANANAHDASADTVAAGHKADNGFKTKSGVVGDLDLGRGLNEKGDITDRTQTFSVGDQVCASIDSDNLLPGTLTATMKSKDGAVIATDSVEIKDGQENAGFHLGNKAVAGSYVISISSSNGGHVESQWFLVGGKL